jgi:hypothetical protein
MSLQKTPIAGFTFNTPEGASSDVQLSVTGTIAPTANGIATVTTGSAHGLVVGNHVTFSGATVTGYNGTGFTILSVPSTTTFTIASSLGTSAGTIKVARVIYMLAGMTYFVTGANATLEYNPDNTGYPQNDPTNTVTGATWRTAIPVSSAGCAFVDGFGMRLNCNQTNAGTTNWSRIK